MTRVIVEAVLRDKSHAGVNSIVFATPMWSVQVDGEERGCFDNEDNANNHAKRWREHLDKGSTEF